MKRFFLVSSAVILLFGAGAVALVAWLTRDGTPGREEPPLLAAQQAPPAGAALLALPAEPTARDAALESNEERDRFAALVRGFAGRKRNRASEVRLLPALDELFPGRTVRWTLECREILCRLDVDAPASEWRGRFSSSREVRRNAERVIFDPEGAGVAFVELVEAKVADGPERPEGERILEDLERSLLASEAARACLAEGPPGSETEVRLAIDQSGVTYRFGSATDRAVAYCLMMQAMPDVVGGVAAPSGVQRAERKVRLASR